MSEMGLVQTDHTVVATRNPLTEILEFFCKFQDRKMTFNINKHCQKETLPFVYNDESQLWSYYVIHVSL